MPFINYFLGNKRLNYVILLFVLIAGVHSYVTMPKELFPEIALDKITISGGYAGTSAETLDKMAVRDIEDSLEGINGIDMIETVVRPGSFSIVITLVDGADTTDALNKAKDAIARSRQYLPPDMVEPTAQLAVRVRPLFSLSLSSDLLSRAELIEAAKEIKTRFSRLPNVSEVTMYGDADEEVSIRLDSAAISAYGLNRSGVISAISNLSYIYPIGAIEQRGDFVFLSTVAGKSSAQEWAQSMVQVGNKRVRLGDIAHIVIEYPQDTTVSTFNGTAAGAEAAATKAAQEGATVILGPLFAQSVAAAAPVARTAGLSVIAFSTDDSVAGGNVFLIGLLPGAEVERVVSYAATQGISNFGALAPQNRLGDVTLAAMREAVMRNGGRLSIEERYAQDFQGIEEGVRAYADQHLAQPEIDPIQSVLLADQGQALQSVAAYLAYFDVSPRTAKFIGPGGWNSAETLRETSLRGGWFAAPDPRLQTQFTARYEQAYGAQPHQLASLGYDAVAAAGAMLADARARNEAFPFTVQSITTPAGFQGVNGVVRFLPSGLNERGLAVLEVGPEGFSVIDPAPLGFAGY